jgi:hypothetical protein
MAWRGKARDRRFSRRGALCASAWQGPTNAEAFHFHPTMRPEACGPPGTCLGQADASLAGVRSSPLRGGRVGERGLAGKGRRWRESRFSRRDALCASPWQGLPHGGDLVNRQRGARDRFPNGIMPRRIPCFYPWACGARPSGTCFLKKDSIPTGGKLRRGRQFFGAQVAWTTRAPLPACRVHIIAWVLGIGCLRR